MVHQDPPTRESTWTWPLLAVLLGPVVLWAVLFAAFPPGRQEFPLNDDWAYSKGLFALARGEGIQYCRQGSMPLLGQWLWALPFVGLLGESHVALRLSTILLSGIGVAAFFDLLRQAGTPPRPAAFAAAALALNPLFFLLSGTFLSDVPALALSLVALALYGRALNGSRRGILAAACAVAVLAAITRQNTVAAPVAAGILAWRDPGQRWRPAWVVAVLLPVGAGVLAHTWFNARPDAVSLGARVPSEEEALFLLFLIFHTLGLVCLPLLVTRPANGSWRWVGLALVLMLAGAYWASFDGEPYQHSSLYPYVGNMVSRSGAMGSSSFAIGSRPLIMGEEVRILLTLLGCWGGAGLLARSPHALSAGLGVRLLLLFSAGHLLILLISPTLYDRYLIVLMPGALALAAASPAAARLYWPVGLGVLAAFAIASAGLMHDWLAWNSARWELGRRALARDIAVSDIEGGFEWDGWHSDFLVGPKGVELPPRGLMHATNRRRFPHLTGRYALSFSHLRNTTVRDREPYHLWLVPGERHFFLVEQEKTDK